jgi:transcriptional regulator with XRE-family HTH domain
MQGAKVIQRKLTEAQGGLTQRAFARRLGISLGSLARLRNSPENVTLRTIERICRALAMTPSQFLDETNADHRRRPMENTNWTREQALACFHLYGRLPFGRLHSRNADIVALARAIGRTPGAVAKKLVNFASLDPAQQARGIKGLANTSNLDKKLWEEFAQSPDEIRQQSQRAYKRCMPPQR